MTRKNFSPAYRRKPVSSASNVLESTLDRLRISKKVQEYSAFPHWQEIVGEEIAQVAKPEKILRGKVLLVRVSDAAWAQELSMQKPQIIEKIFHSGLGAAIDDIQFITGNPKDFDGS